MNLYINIALGVVLIAAVAGIAALMMQTRAANHTSASKPKPEVPTPTADVPPEELVGFLIMEDGTRHVVDTDAYLIGRHSSNDLIIRDPSVSRQHAEIHRRPDGTFRITDLDSMNGLFVQKKQLKHAVLKGGELVDLGDISCRFEVQKKADIVSGDGTVVLSANPANAESP